MTPLRIDFKLGGPIGVPRHPIHFDGLLAWLQLMATAPGSQKEVDIQAAIAAVPLAKTMTSHGPLFHASVINFAWEGPSWGQNWTRRSDERVLTSLQSSGTLKGRQANSKILLNSGPFRSAIGVHELGWAESASAYAVGDKKQIADLLADLDHIGKLRRYGYGEVLGYTVEDDEAASQKWKHRFLPADRFDEGLLGEGAYSPPYFHKKQRAIIRDNTCFRNAE